MYSLQDYTGDGAAGSWVLYSLHDYTGIMELGSYTVFRITLVMELKAGVLYSLQDHTGDGAGIWGPIQSSGTHR